MQAIIRINDDRHLAQAVVSAAQAAVKARHPDPVRSAASFGEAFDDPEDVPAGETSARVLAVLPGGEIQQGNVLCALHPRFKCRIRTGSWCASHACRISAWEVLVMWSYSLTQAPRPHLRRRRRQTSRRTHPLNQPAPRIRVWRQIGTWCWICRVAVTPPQSVTSRCGVARSTTIPW